MNASRMHQPAQRDHHQARQSRQRQRRALPFRTAISSLIVGALVAFAIPEGADAEDVGAAAWMQAAVQDTVRGKVTEEGTGQPLADVLVMVTGTDMQTVTNAQGDYVLGVPGSGRLVFARLGYRSAEVELAGQERIDVAIEISAAELDEIVVTGYTAQRRADITGAIASVDMENVGRETSSSVLQRLAGNVAGVTVTGSGSPGGRSTVRIRGVGSFQNNEPLYIIDGVPMTENSDAVTTLSGMGMNVQTTASFANSLNPSDIESIQVLKDASAASIYGARASNGVVIIETKKGRAGPPQFSLDAKFGMSTPYRGYDDFVILDALDYAEVVRRSIVNAGQEFQENAFPRSIYGDPNNPSVPQFIYCGAGVPVVSGACESAINESDYAFPGNLIMPGSAGTNWWDAVFGSAPATDLNFRVAGGGEGQRYAVSFNYYNQEGTAAYNRYQRGTVRVNTDFNLGRLTVGENISLSFDEHFGGIAFDDVGENTIIGKNMLSQPVVPVYDVAGNFASGKTPGLGNNTNPLKVAWGDKDDVFRNSRMFGSTFARLDVTDALQLNTAFAFDLGEGSGTDFNPITPEDSEANLVTNFTELSNNFRNWTWTNTLTWNLSFGQPGIVGVPGSPGTHNATVLLGQAAEKNTSRAVVGSIADLTSTDINARFIQDVLGDASTKNINTAGGNSTLLSYFGKVDYNYAERYYLSFTLRRDGSSRLGSANRWGTFPAVNAGWRLSQESFLAQSTFLTNLMLRFGWGVTGNQNIAAGRIVNQYGGSTGDTFYDITGSDGDIVPGFRLTAIGNDSLKWEENETLNAGLDAELFGGRLSLALDVYQKDSDNLLFNPPLPATAGQADPPIVNVGKVRNRGIDIGIGYRGTFGDQIGWNVNVNGAHYTNEIIRIDGDRNFFFGPTTTRFTTTGVTINRLGQPIGSFYGLVQEGIFQNQAEIDQLNAGAPDGVYQDGAAPGRFRFKDVSGPDGVPDGRVTAADQTIIGDPHPDFTAGLNLGLEWRRWDFNASLFGTFGNDIFDVQKEFYVFRNFNTNVRRDLLTDAAVVENGEVINPDAKYARLDVTDDFSRQTSSFYVEDGSYVRMRSLQIGYRLPESLIPGFNSVRVWLQGENLFTITGYSGLDPSLPAINERVAGMDVRDQAQGIDRGVYPTNRIFSVGFNVEF